MVPPDSLEMLLDTMCNTFGGIILIALLIALLARDAKVARHQPGDAVETSGLLQLQVEQAEQDLVRAQARAEELRREMESPARRELLAQMEARDQARRTAEALLEQVRGGPRPPSMESVISRIADLSEKTRLAERELVEMRNLGASLTGRVDQLRRGVQEQSNRLAQAAARRTQRLRLPRERETTKSHLYLIARHGTIYPVHFFRNGSPERNTGSLRWIEEGPQNTRIEPLPGSGIRPEPTSPAFALYLKDVPTDQVYLVFQVYPDSFSAFNQAKETAVARGFEYTWEPRLESVPLRIGAGARPRGPQ